MRLAGHPVHPMLVHFPIAFWTSALGADLAGLATSMAIFSAVAFWSCALGCVTGAVAMLAGVADFADLPKTSPARNTAVNHLMAMCGALAIYLFSIVLRGYPPVAPTPFSAVLATTIGFAAMLVGSRLGGKLVFEFGVAQTRSPGGSPAGKQAERR